MTGALVHRGPDSDGVWVDVESGAALGHRRLAIVDLTPAGHQPMVSRSGRFILSYNGEIYSHQEMRSDLRRSGVEFRGTSDTEVLLEACASWSVERTLPLLNGMFAFALWDRAERVLTLVRDRLGIKPLYYGQFGDAFLFGSELKALRAHPAFESALRRDAIAAFMRHGYIPGPHTIYEGVHKLEPGTVLTLRVGEGGQPQLSRYWDLRGVARESALARSRPGASDLVEQLDALLRDAVGRRMLADVPLGAFLSGGIDSSTVAALMQAQSDRPVKTYSIGFEHSDFDEAPYARAVAKHLGTEHTELYVSPDAALNVVSELPHWFDEPFADSSQIPTLLVSRLTRQHVTVALSGDGGDELFAGYGRYFWTLKLDRWLRRIPLAMRGSLHGALNDPFVQGLLRLAPGRLGKALSPSRLKKLAAVLRASDSGALYRQILSLWSEPTELVRCKTEATGRLWDPTLTDGILDLTERMQLIDTLTYLPDDILTKVDRASMAVALEARVPLLDYRVVEFAWRLPLDMKLRNGAGKWILREVLARYVPKRLVERPKKGFGVPISTWLRGPLRGWAEDLLQESELESQGILEPNLVKRTWREHLDGQYDWGPHLWAILMLQSWLRKWH